MQHRNQHHSVLRPAHFVLCVVVLLTACVTGPNLPANDAETKAEMVARGRSKEWIDFGRHADPGLRRRVVEHAVKMSRSAMAPYYDRLIKAGMAAEQVAAQRKATEKAESAVLASKPVKRSVDDEFGFEFRDARLDEVVYLIAGELGINVFVPTELTERITASFPSVPGRSGLDTILERFGYRLVDKEGIHTVEQIGNAPLVSRTFQVNTGAATEIEKQLDAMLTGRSTYVIDQSARTVFVSAPKEDIDRIAMWIDTLDQRRPQVIIEALIVEVVRNKTFKWGSDVNFDVSIDDTLSTISSGFLPTAALGAATNPFEVGIVNSKSAIDVLLSAQNGIERLNVVHSPFVSAISGTKSQLKVVESIPYIKAETSIDAGEGAAGTVTSSSTVEFEEAGVTLDVAPTVGADDIVEIWIKPRVEELVGFLFDTPIIDTREAEATIAVRNHETLVIGGMLRGFRQYRENGVPVLSDIPIIGEFFKNIDEQNEQLELLIFLTPHIVGYGFEEVKGFKPQEHFLGEGKMYPNATKQMLQYK